MGKKRKAHPIDTDRDHPKEKKASSRYSTNATSHCHTTTINRLSHIQSSSHCNNKMWGGSSRSRGSSSRTQHRASTVSYIRRKL